MSKVKTTVKSREGARKVKLKLRLKKDKKRLKLQKVGKKSTTINGQQKKYKFKTKCKDQRAAASKAASKSSVKGSSKGQRSSKAEGFAYRQSKPYYTRAVAKQGKHAGRKFLRATHHVCWDLAKNKEV
eukprot:544170_1